MKKAKEPIKITIDKAVRCVKCGAHWGKCDCWWYCCCGYAVEKNKPCPNCGYPEHIESETCWCQPTLGYEDPETGAQVWVHRRRDN